MDIATNRLPSVRVLGELRAGVITYRNVVREHMLAEGLDEKLAAEKNLATVIESDNKIRATYEALISSPDERALYNEWSKLWDEYKKGADEVVVGPLIKEKKGAEGHSEPWPWPREHSSGTWGS